MSRSQRFFALPAVSLPAISMPGGMIRGVEIDNSSGSWLFIPSFETFVPPFTIGWAMGFPYGASSIDIIASPTGPAGQVSTAQGSGVTVYLDDGDVASSPGGPDPSAPAPYQFTSQFTLQQSTGGKNLALDSANGYGSGGQFIGASPPPDKRIRVYGTNHNMFSTGASFPPTFVSIYMTNDGGATSTGIWQAMLSPERLSDAWNPATPWDLPVGYALGVSAQQESPYAGGSPTSIGNVAALIINVANFSVI